MDGDKDKQVNDVIVKKSKRRVHVGTQHRKKKKKSQKKGLSSFFK